MKQRAARTLANWIETSRWPLPALLGLCIARLWLAPLPSSLWVDEMETVFVAAHPGHPSLDIARQAFTSVYYWLPRAAHAVTGSSEISYRLPSVLAMAAALFFIGRLAARLIHPHAGWFTVFACLALPGIDYYAADARPYALGMMVASASIFFLVRWLDAARWSDAALFTLFTALIWRVHLVYWPFYTTIAIYALSRLLRDRVRIPRLQWIAVMTALAIMLMPVASDALTLVRDAQAHVFVPRPTLAIFAESLQWQFILLCGAAFYLLADWLRWPVPAHRPGGSASALIFSWWLCTPVLIFLYSKNTHNSLYVDRYLSLMLPGLVLAATLAAARWIPETKWRSAAICMALAALVSQGHWTGLLYRHSPSDWREASAEVNLFAEHGGATPVIVPSPFIEARPPVWSPSYSLPGFLYCYLDYYPIHGSFYLFPFKGADGIGYATRLARGSLSGAKKFAIYGGGGPVEYWQSWFAARPEFAEWTSTVKMFGDVYVAEFERSTSGTSATPQQ